MPGLVPIGDFNGASDGTMAFNTNQSGSQFRAALTALLEQVAGAIIADDPTLIQAAIDALEDAIPELDLVQAPGPDGRARIMSSAGHVGVVVEETGETEVSRSSRGAYMVSRDRRVIQGADDQRHRVISDDGRVFFEIDEHGVTHIAQLAAARSVPSRVVVNLILGQSNAAGRGRPTSARDYQHSRAWMWDWSASDLADAAVPLSTPMDEAHYGFGNDLPRLQLAATGDDTVVVTVNAAVGATALIASNDRTNGNWSVNYAGSNPHLLDQALAAYDAAIAAIATAWPGATVDTWAYWLQGEADAQDGPTGYLGEYTDLIAAVRAHVGGLVPWVAAGAVPEAGGIAAGWPTVREALIQATANLEHVAYVDGVDNGGGANGVADTIHYTREGQERLAVRLWDGARRAAAMAADGPSHKPLDVTATRVGNDVTVAWSHPWSRATGFEVEWSTDQATWTAVTRAFAADFREEFTATGAGTSPIYIRVRTICAGATVPESGWTIPTLALRG